MPSPHPREPGREDAPLDALETRDPAAREAALFARLREVLAAAAPHAPALAARLGDADPATLRTRADLAALPVLRKSDLPALQAASPPFAGLVPTAPGRLKRLLVSPGPILDPEGWGGDWWGSARALHAAGMRAGDVVHNAFSYHLTPGGHIMEAGAHALGCAVVPAGTEPAERQLDALIAYRPSAFTGTPDFLHALLTKAEEGGRDVSSIRRALVSGAAFPPSLQAALAARGVDATQAYATADLGVIAYETVARAGLVVNEGVLVEVLRPGTGDPVPEGEVGEVVVTRLSPDYPLLRFATGDLSKLLPGASPCGRTAPRLAGWLGRADQTTKLRGMFVRPEGVAAIARAHPTLGRLRLVVTREGERDGLRLLAESPPADGLAARLADTAREMLKLRAEVELVPPDSLPNDGKVIADERGAG